MLIKNFSLQKYTAFGNNVRAKFFLEIRNKKDFDFLINFLNKNNVKKILVLGGGKNIIFKKKVFDGLVIKILNKKLDFNLTKKEVLVGSGVLLDKLVLETNKRDFFSMSSLSSIPGELGGSVFGNAGAYGEEIGTFVKKVEIFDLKDKKIKVFNKKDLYFSYRNSCFKENKNRYIIWSVILSLKKKPKKEIWKYKSVQDFLKNSRIEKKDKNLRKIIQIIRREKFSTLKEKYTAGSFFKNIVVNKQELEKLKNKNDNLVFFERDDDFFTIPTAYILDKLMGWKGKKIGKIILYENNPLILYSNHPINGLEIEKSVEKIKEAVKEKTGFVLEEEVNWIS